MAFREVVGAGFVVLTPIPRRDHHQSRLERDLGEWWKRLWLSGIRVIYSRCIELPTTSRYSPLE